MRIYVACPWGLRDRAEDFAQLLTDVGEHDIARYWWEHEDTHDFEELSTQAQLDLEAVADSDLVVVLNYKVNVPSEGKAVEMGAAIILGIPVIAVMFGNESPNIFYKHPGVLMVETLSDACVAISAVERFGGEDETIQLVHGRHPDDHTDEYLGI